MEIASHRPGSISFVDLGAINTAVQSEFYTTMLGWQALDVPGARYSMFLADGRPVAGMMEASADLSAWSVYVTVEDADQTCERVRALGGAVLRPPEDVAGGGRVAIVADPGGAVVCVFAGWPDGGFKLFDEPGAPCWFEAMNTRAAKSVEFYHDLFGWEPRQNDDSPFEYWVLHHADRDGVSRAIASVMQFPAGHEAHSFWQVSFSIHTDVATFIERAQILGATVQMGPAATPFGTAALISDPAGATFGVFDRSTATTPPT